MCKLDTDTLLFFDGHEDALDLYRTFEERLYHSFPIVNKRVQKTQITFINRHVFACISFARVKRKAELPEGYMVLTLGLRAPLDSERIVVKTAPYPNRWTHHIVLSRPEELDDELFTEKVKIIFDKDVENIMNADIIFMVVDGRVPDEGACVELGIGYANGKRCYGCKTDTRSLEIDLDLNPLISGCFIKIFKNFDGDKLIEELQKYLSENAL